MPEAMRNMAQGILSVMMLIFDKIIIKILESPGPR